MGKALPFVKGHCGWDVVTLLPEGHVSLEDELPTAIKILSAPIDGGLEVGWLGAGERADEIRLRMVNSTTKNWIPMCGGMTQVIGRALVETFFRDLFDIDVSRPMVTRTLITASGAIPIQISIRGGVVAEVTTIMDGYLSYMRQRGIERLFLHDIPLLRVGTYAVIDLAVLEKKHPNVDFTRRDSGPHLDIINVVLRSFREVLGVKGVNGMLYDNRPEGTGQFRVFPRFYSDDLAAARLPWEFQCGTGSVAVATALAFDGKLPFAAGKGLVVFEWGSRRTTPDPYGIRTSRIELELSDRSITKATFSHSVVEILAEGSLTLPGY